MKKPIVYGNQSGAELLKVEALYNWLNEKWLTQDNIPESTILTSDGRTILNPKAIGRMVNYKVLNVSFKGYSPMSEFIEGGCDAVIKIQAMTDYKPDVFSGAYVLKFEIEDNELGVIDINIPILSTGFKQADIHSWMWYTTTLVAVPNELVDIWGQFEAEFSRITNAFDSEGKVFVVGGKIASFVPKINWDDIILPDELKHDLISDVENFFNKGVGVYTKLGLKPFRKLLLAGPPGTGKTMISTAIAKQGLDNGRVVIYVSSALKSQSDPHSATFSKIEHALELAANSAVPAIIILEEFDAYLHDDEKSMILNVLDGNESPLNSKGTLLIATTNYPEAIDERIMKRPGRMDRIFVIPEVKRAHDAETILRQYLGDMWNDSHLNIIHRLVSYPPAFIREVAILALTRCACEDMPELPYDILNESFLSLKDQISARDSFLKGRQPFNGLNGENTKDIEPAANGTKSKPGLPY